MSTLGESPYITYIYIYLFIIKMWFFIKKMITRMSSLIGGDKSAARKGRVWAIAESGTKIIPASDSAAAAN